MYGPGVFVGKVVFFCTWLMIILITSTYTGMYTTTTSNLWCTLSNIMYVSVKVILMENTVFHGTQNFELSRRTCQFPWNFCFHGVLLNSVLGTNTTAYFGWDQVAIDNKSLYAEAGLGMFSMFGRTGAPTKMGPPQEENDVCVCRF